MKLSPGYYKLGVSKTFLLLLYYYYTKYYSALSYCNKIMLENTLHKKSIKKVHCPSLMPKTAKKKLI